MKDCHAILMDDGHTRIIIDVNPEYLGEGEASITLIDSGGFSSVYVNKENIQNIIKELQKILEML